MRSLLKGIEERQDPTPQGTLLPILDDIVPIRVRGAWPALPRHVRGSIEPGRVAKKSLRSATSKFTIVAFLMGFGVMSSGSMTGETTDTSKGQRWFAAGYRTN